MMKHAAMHYDDFEHPIRAFNMGLLKFVALMLVEFINLWNLANITEGGTYQLMFDFIALGIIAEFDAYFIEIYKYTTMSAFLEVKIATTNVRSLKSQRMSVRETRAYRKLKAIRK